MDIKNRGALKQDAAAALRDVRSEKQIIAIYTGVTIAAAVVLLVLDLLLERAVSGTGGLSNLGTRSILQTLQAALPVVQLVFLLCWDAGYLRTAMNMSRGWPAEPKTLKVGFRLFGPVLRLDLLLGLIFGGLLFACMYLGTWIFMFTPMAQPLMDIVSSTDTTSILSTEMVITAEMTQAVSQVMLPMMAICLLLFAVIALPRFYSYRMASYCLLDAPKAGALAAMRKSKFMMYGKRMDLFKLDLSLWWFYLLEGVLLIVSEMPLVLSLLGIQLPLSSTVSSYLFLSLYYVLTFGFHVAFRNYCQVIYVKAYDALLPPEAPSGGVVLGNIFQM